MNFYSIEWNLRYSQYLRWFFLDKERHKVIGTKNGILDLFYTNNSYYICYLTENIIKINGPSPILPFEYNKFSLFFVQGNNNLYNVNFGYGEPLIILKDGYNATQIFNAIDMFIFIYDNEKGVWREKKRELNILKIF